MIQDRYISSVLGSCHSTTRPCIVENSVSAAAISFTGNIEGTFHRFLYMGPLVGECTGADGRGCIISNCANYGPVTQAGSVGSMRVGGIVGHCHGTKSPCIIRNSINYGTITHSGTTSDLFVGGIVSYIWGYSFVEGCVSIGAIKINSSKCINEIAGSLVGRSLDSTAITWCFWDDELIKRDPISDKSTGTTILDCSSFDDNFELSDNVTVKNYTGTSLLGALNAYASTKKLSKWALNRGSHTVNFRVNDRPLLSHYRRQVVLLPDLSDEGTKMLFEGWYTDCGCTRLLETFEMAQDTTLYSLWLDGKGTSLSSSTPSYSYSIQPPLPSESSTSSSSSAAKLPSACGRGCDREYVVKKRGGKKERKKVRYNMM